MSTDPTTPVPELPRYVRNLLATGPPEARLRALVEARAAVNSFFEAAIDQVVRDAKTPRTSWQQIADILGVNRSTVQRRYGHLVGQQPRGRRRKS